MNERETQPVPAAPPSATPSAAPGLVLGRRFKLVRQLGKGGMGTVWVAEHTALKYQAAVKIMTVSVADDAQYASRFLREAELAATVRHAAIVRATDFGNDQGILWYAMELLEGEALDDHLRRRGSISPRELTELLAPLVSALAFLHAQGLVHRDLKPSNVFVARVAGRPGPELRLFDFGIARRIDDDVRLTTSHAVLGSPAYMAPEQARGEREHGPAADQYALAVIVYEALTGHLPHNAPSVQAMVYARASRGATPITDHRTDLPDAFAAAVMKALEPLPDDRHASIEAFGEALRRSLLELSDTALSLPPARDEPPASPPSVPRASSRRPLALASIAMGSLLLAGVAVVSHRPASSTAPSVPARGPRVAATPVPVEHVTTMVSPALPDAAALAMADATAETTATTPASHHTHTGRRHAETPGDSPLVRTMQRIYRDLPGEPTGERRQRAAPTP